MLHALVAAIIGIDKPGSEIWRQSADGKAMILCRDIAALRAMQEAGLVLAAMPKFQLIGIATSRQCQQLMAQANAKRWNLALQRCSEWSESFSCTIFGLPGPLEITMPSKAKLLAGENRS